MPVCDEIDSMAAALVEDFREPHTVFLSKEKYKQLLIECNVARRISLCSVSAGSLNTVHTCVGSLKIEIALNAPPDYVNVSENVIIDVLTRLGLRF